MGNCLDRSLSDEGESDDLIETAFESRSRRRSNNYRILDQHSTSSSLLSLTTNNNCVSSQINHSQTEPRRIFNHSTSSIHDPNSFFTNRSTYTNSELFLNASSSLPLNLNSTGSISSLGSLQPNSNSSNNQQQQQQVFYLTPNVQRTADQLTEEEQIKLLKRMTLIQQLPAGSYDESKKNKE